MDSVARRQDDFTSPGDQSVSSSAISVLRLKALADVPYAHAVLDELAARSGVAAPVRGSMNGHLARAAHFEDRYRSVDELLSTLRAPAILEMSAGFSFRSVDYARRFQVRYLDTDLVPVISLKRQLFDRLRAREPAGTAFAGEVDFLGLDVSSTPDWRAVEPAVGTGDVTVVNEGLLMYLTHEQKAGLCARVRDLLRGRDGHWITGDIYIRSAAAPPAPGTATERTFNERHRMWDNRFASFAEAEDFFRANGFRVIARAARQRRLVSLESLRDRGALTDGAARTVGADRQTWALAPDS